MALDALYTTGKVGAAVVRKQIDGELKLIGRGKLVWRVARAGEHSKFVLQTARQDQRTPAGIAQCIAVCCQASSQLICCGETLLLAQSLACLDPGGARGRHGGQVGARIELALRGLTQQVLAQAKAQDTVKVEQLAHLLRGVQLARAQHFPDQGHGSGKIQIILDRLQQSRLPGRGGQWVTGQGRRAVAGQQEGIGAVAQAFE